MVRDILTLMRVGTGENKCLKVLALHHFAKVGQSLTYTHISLDLQIEPYKDTKISESKKLRGTDFA
jgi:hypothetical protein